MSRASASFECETPKLTVRHFRSNFPYLFSPSFPSLTQEKRREREGGEGTRLQPPKFGSAHFCLPLEYGPQPGRSWSLFGSGMFRAPCSPRLCWVPWVCLRSPWRRERAKPPKEGEEHGGKEQDLQRSLAWLCSGSNIKKRFRP